MDTHVYTHGHTRLYTWTHTSETPFPLTPPARFQFFRGRWGRGGVVSLGFRV